MMKSVFALVVLLHLCYTAKLDMNVNEEIQERLAKLTRIKVHYTTPGFVHVPIVNRSMSLSSCVGDFARLLKAVLGNVTAPGHNDLLRELKENLNLLKPHGETNPNCQTDQIRLGPIVFHKFLNFLKKLNEEKER